MLHQQQSAWWLAWFYLGSWTTSVLLSDVVQRTLESVMEESLCFRWLHDWWFSIAANIVCARTHSHTHILSNRSSKILLMRDKVLWNGSDWALSATCSTAFSTFLSATCLSSLSICASIAIGFEVVLMPKILFWSPCFEPIYHQRIRPLFWHYDGSRSVDNRVVVDDGQKDAVKKYLLWSFQPHSWLCVLVMSCASLYEYHQRYLQF